MKKILVAVDGSSHSDKVIEEASKLASALSAKAELLTVLEEITTWEQEIPQSKLKEIHSNRLEKMEKYLQEKAELFSKNNVPLNIRIKKGHPGQVICEVAKEENFYYIVLGCRGFGGIANMLLGSVCNRVAHCAETNVIIIK